MRRTITADDPSVQAIYGIGIEPGPSKRPYQKPKKRTTKQTREEKARSAERRARKAYYTRLERAIDRGELPPWRKAGRTKYWFVDELDAHLEAQGKKEQAS